ncbi:MAG: hypothetical protein ACFFCS_13425 [Candidatus Hodarchaeota archaeon]
MASEIEKIIDDMVDTIPRIAATAVISDKGKVIFQNGKWDVAASASAILKVVAGASSFNLSGFELQVGERTPNGYIAAGQAGMGYVVINPFAGGVLVTYALQNANPHEYLTNFHEFALKISGKM